jgi:two-component system sensor kinase ParS
MRRLFISLYLALVAAFAICAVAVPWLFQKSLERPLAQYSEQLSAAPQFLFEQELSRHPQSQWPQVIRELQSEFGYELTLRPIDEIPVDATTRDRLRAGQPLTPPDDAGRMIDMLLPIRGSGLVVTTRFMESDFERAQRGFGGIYALIERQLATIPPAQRAAQLLQLEARFDVPLRLVTPQDTGLDAAQRRQLARGQVVGVDMDAESSGERYYKVLDDGSAVLQVGPLPVPAVLDFALPALYAALAAVLALITFLWVRPLWRDMRRLEQRALALGAGEFDARVDVAGTSAVRPLADTFNSMASRIQALITQQRELNNAVSHELRTPLARLRFGLDMLGRSGSDADRSRYAQGMTADIAELESLVQESLEYSRLNTPTEPALIREPVALAPWLDSLVAANRDLAGTLQVSCDVEPAHAEASVDRRLMTRAVQNLVRNAFQHARQRVAIRIADADGATEILIDDDGPGIPPDQREAIFLPFHRVDESRDRGTGGHGLGLAIARRIFDAHGASVSVETSPMGGARFRVRLPGQAGG